MVIKVHYISIFTKNCWLLLLIERAANVFDNREKVLFSSVGSILNVHSNILKLKFSFIFKTFSIDIHLTLLGFFCIFFFSFIKKFTLSTVEAVLSEFGTYQF